MGTPRVGGTKGPRHGLVTASKSQGGRGYPSPPPPPPPPPPHHKVDVSAGLDTCGSDCVMHASCVARERSIFRPCKEAAAACALTCASPPIFRPRPPGESEWVHPSSHTFILLENHTHTTQQPPQNTRLNTRVLRPSLLEMAGAPLPRRPRPRRPPVCRPLVPPTHPPTHPSCSLSHGDVVPCVAFMPLPLCVCGSARQGACGLWAGRPPVTTWAIGNL